MKRQVPLSYREHTFQTTQQSTYDFLPNLLGLILVLQPDTHIPVNKHTPAVFVDQNVAATDIAVKNLRTLVRRTVC